MKKFLLLIAAFPLWAQESESPKENSFIYLNTGALVQPRALEFSAADISVGLRSLNSHHVFDRALGIAIHREYQIIYGQCSYLYFPQLSQGPYLGAGITAGVAGTPFDTSGWGGFWPFINVPLTIGYQFRGDRVQFIQLQATPLMTGAISYGFSF